MQMESSTEPQDGALSRVEIFNVRIVRRGEHYGRDDCVAHDRDDPLVEFYDSRRSAKDFGPRGQFVSRYYASTLMARQKPVAGLLLDTGSPDWTVSPAGMRKVLVQIRAALGMPSDADEESTTGADSSPRPLVEGDKVFVISEQKLATVLDNYGDGRQGWNGDVRLDLCGNTALANIERYDPVKHAAFDHTFVPIKAEWKAFYGITQDVPLREADEAGQMRDRHRG